MNLTLQYSCAYTKPLDFCHFHFYIFECFMLFLVLLSTMTVLLFLFSKRYTTSGVKKSPSLTPGASNFHIWASWNNQLYARRASKNIYIGYWQTCQYSRIYLYLYVICCLISSNVLFIQPLAFCRNWEQRR